MCDEDEEGVIAVPLAPQDENDTAQGAIRNKLKFSEPKLAKLPKKPKLTQEMKDMFIKHMDINNMDEELLDAWAVDMFMGGENGNE